jgi:hypothetical protein
VERPANGSAQPAGGESLGGNGAVEETIHPARPDDRSVGGTETRRHAEGAGFMPHADREQVIGDRVRRVTTGDPRIGPQRPGDDDGFGRLLRQDEDGFFLKTRRKRSDRGTAGAANLDATDRQTAWAAIRRGFIETHDRRGESVPTAGERFDELRRRTPIAERHPDLPEAGVEARVELDVGARWPESAVQFLSGDQTARTLEQAAQDGTRLRPEPDAVRPPPQLTGGCVKPEITETIARHL